MSFSRFCIYVKAIEFGCKWFKLEFGFDVNLSQICVSVNIVNKNYF